MSQATNVSGCCLAVAATAAISAAGVLMTPTPAMATPMFPLAPKCQDFQFPSLLQLNQGDLVLQVPVTGNPPRSVGPGAASYSIPGRTTLTVGVLSGPGLIGRNIDFTVRWQNNTTGHYTGRIRDDGFASGTTTDGTNSAKWRSSESFPCVYVPPKPQAPPQPPLQGPIPVDPPRQGPLPPDSMSKRVDVTGDVEVHDAPGGVGNVIGELDGGEGQTVGLYACNPENWCRIAFAGGPDGKGWVWGDFLARPGQ